MLINNKNQKNRHVEFVSYNGEYPCLCSGSLILKIDGKEYVFGSGNYKKKDLPNLKKYLSFWESGGGLDEDYVAYEAPWIIDYDELPEFLKQYAEEIDEVFNENVPYGCCGGCS